MRHHTGKARTGKVGGSGEWRSWRRRVAGSHHDGVARAAAGHGRERSPRARRHADRRRPGRLGAARGRARGRGRHRRGGHPADCGGWPPPSVSTLGGRLVSYFDANERSRLPELLERAARRRTRRCSSPTPGCRACRDPGYRLVAAAVEAGVTVTAVPGPVGRAHGAGAVRAAGGPVLLRGLPAAPGRASARARLAGARRPTRARWCSSRRRTGWPASLTAMADALRGGPAGGGVPGADEDVRGGAARAARRARAVGRRRRQGRGHGRGPAVRRAARSPRLAGPGPDPRKAAIAAVAAAFGIAKRAAYDAVVAARKATDR